MNPLQPLPLKAFCILCRDMDDNLAFYTDVLGLAIKRREESFIAFDTPGLTLCLWEIGHVASHLNVPLRPTGAEPIKARIPLCLPEPSFRQLPIRLREAKVAFEDSPSGIRITDQHATDWLVQAHNAATATASGVVLYVADLGASIEFYTNKLGCSAVVDTAGSGRIECANNCYFTLEVAPGVTDRSCITMAALGFASSIEMRNAVAQLERGGIEFHSPPKTQDWGFDAGYFTDPDGHVWELYATERQL